MADILFQIPIDAEPAQVYQALTEQSGLSSWWTDDVQAKAQEGSQAVFTFEGGMVMMKMKVVELDEPNRVVWDVLDPAPPEWDETMVTFDISEREEGGSSLLFGHRGWKSTEGSYPGISYSWAYYLTSLKDYLEKGKGFPFVNA